MKVLGVDPAPGKGLSVFDGLADRHVPLNESRAFLESARKDPDVLICWDAPLTGPRPATLNGGAASGSDFTQRAIEKFFSRKVTGHKTPKGISVLGYAGCPHWSLSRSLLGLPRTGPFDAAPEELPFQLRTQDRPPDQGHWIVEVHPAVALWIWLRPQQEYPVWSYKKDDLLLREFWTELLASAWRNLPGFPSLRPPSNDDELDARIAFALGRLWIDSGSSEVGLLGSLGTGTFLLPRDSDLFADFRRFVA